MPLVVRQTLPGRPAGKELAAALATAKRSGVLKPVTVLVPSDHVAVATRRQLGRSDLGAPPGPARPGAPPAVEAMPRSPSSLCTASPS